MVPDVVETDSLPINRSLKSKYLKNKNVIRHKVIDVDINEDFGEVMVFEKKVDTNNKGKEPMTFISSGLGSAANLEYVDGVQSSNKNSDSGSRKLDNFSYGDDDFMDMMYIDSRMYDDDYAILQSHLDNIDILPAVEAPIAWLPPGQSVPQMHGPFPVAKERKHSSHSAEPMRKKSTSKSSLTLKATFHGANQLHKLEPFSPWTSDNTTESKRSIDALASSKMQLGASDAASVKQRRRLWRDSCLNYKNSTVSGSSSNYGPHNPLGATKPCPGTEPFAGGSNLPISTNKQFGSKSLYSNPPMPIETMYPAPGGDTYMPNWLNPLNKQSYPDYPVINPFHTGHIFREEVAYQPYVHDYSIRQSCVTDLGNSSCPSGSSTGVEKQVNEDEILKKFQLFKKFDTVQDHSDHHYVCNGSSMNLPSKNWAKKIQKEWKILEKDLPDAIHVRVYESRMDLLRAVIVGAEGTPYHDCLFFFDVYFPPSYPNVPPQVYYHSGGIGLNPNLYDCGTVCLSLLNTWPGSETEKWTPGLSTILQVLVSIQGLILNAKPFFNEPGYANMSGTLIGEKQSLLYNERTFILSLKAMVYTMRKPPQHFEDYVMGHFFSRARDILVACKAYMAGAQVGSFVRGGVHDVDEGDKSCSEILKGNLGMYMRMLLSSFKEFGVKGCDEFIPTPAQMGNVQLRNRLVSPELNIVPCYHY